MQMEQHFSEDYSERELEVLRKHVQKANPPSILYRYRGDSERTLSEISEPHIFFCEPRLLNDPFEYRAPIRWDKESIRRQWGIYASERGMNKEQAEREFVNYCNDGIQALQNGFEALQMDSGVACFSAVPNSVRMWSYYANSHRGICIGYDSSKRPFRLAMAVNYQNPESPIDIIATSQGSDPTILADHISLRKGSEWSFEQEYRIPMGPVNGRPRSLPIAPQAIASIRFGAAISTEFREKLIDALKNIPHRPRLIQMHCDYDRFILTEQSVG